MKLEIVCSTIWIVYHSGCNNGFEVETGTQKVPWEKFRSRNVPIAWSDAITWDSVRPHQRLISIRLTTVEWPARIISCTFELINFINQFWFHQFIRKYMKILFIRSRHAPTRTEMSMIWEATASCTSITYKIDFRSSNIPSLTCGSICLAYLVDCVVSLLAAALSVWSNWFITAPGGSARNSLGIYVASDRLQEAITVEMRHQLPQFI